MDAVRALNLSKRYRGDTLALDRVSLRIRRGRIVSLLGRNGAGKTTLVRILATQLMPTSGRASVLGYDVVKEPEKIRERIACIPQEAEPVGFLNVWEHVYGYLLMRGMGSSEARGRAEEVLRVVGLEGRKRTLASELSGGMQRKLLLGMVLATSAEILFLDEPTTGLDLPSRGEVWKLLRELRGEGRTIFLTTQNMEEAEALSDEVFLIHRGRILAKGRAEELVQRVGAEVRVEVEGELGPEELGRYGKCIPHSGSVLLYTDREGARRVARVAAGKGIRVRSRPVNLEDFFLLTAGGEDESAQAA
ncbi:MAG: ABC transporter ATP-binding protein [Candidatus Hadarchaeales archaeon]